MSPHTAPLVSKQIIDAQNIIRLRGGESCDQALGVRTLALLLISDTFLGVRAEVSQPRQKARDYSGFRIDPRYTSKVAGKRPFLGSLREHRMVGEVSIITTCKNRLAHLQETLPLMLQQSNATVFIVDYGCEQQSGKWAASAFTDAPNLKIIEVTDDPVFCKSRAMNIAASQCTGDFLFFIDVDIRMKSDFSGWVRNSAQQGRYYRKKPTNSTIDLQTDGCCVVSRADFEAVGGFDEAFRGWGSEDADFYERLEINSVARDFFDSSYVTPILHGNEKRQFGVSSGGYDDETQALIVGTIYRMIKVDIFKITDNWPTLPERKMIFEALLNEHRRLKAAKASAGYFFVTVSAARDKAKHVNFTRKLIYEFYVDRLR